MEEKEEFKGDEEEIEEELNKVKEEEELEWEEEVQEDAKIYSS